MNSFPDTIFSAWQTAADIALELVRVSPGLIAIPVIVGIAVAVLVELLRSRVWVPVFVNGDYRQGASSFCMGLAGGGVTAIGIVGVFALGSVERATDGWRERERSNLSAADGWHFEMFQRLFNEVRESKREDLSNVPDPVANGGNQLPLTKPESWKIATRFYHDATWQRLSMGRAPLCSGWPENPTPPDVPVEPGIVTPNPAENPALFAAIENSTRIAAKHALESVNSRAADFRTALLISMLLLQAISWLTISVAATQDIDG
jgi:hypothetical protein